MRCKTSFSNTHNVALTDHQIAKVLQVEEKVILSNEEQEEPVQKPEVVDLEEDFSVFN